MIPVFITAYSLYWLPSKAAIIFLSTVPSPALGPTGTEEMTGRSKAKYTCPPSVQAKNVVMVTMWNDSVL
jgi:hypothetical protein